MINWPPKKGGNMGGTISWGEEEFSGVSMKDKRLEKRLLHVASRLSKAPTMSINQAHEDWAATKAAYRFL